jgi:hypothetical protein
MSHPPAPCLLCKRKFLSVGTLLNSGLELRGSSFKLEFRTHKSNWLEFLCEPHKLGQNLYWLSATLAHADSLLASTMVPSINYDIMHRRFAHPCYDFEQCVRVKPVLAFGTEQNSIVNSRGLSSIRSQDQVKSEFGERLKECHCKVVLS